MLVCVVAYDVFHDKDNTELYVKSYKPSTAGLLVVMALIVG